MFFVYGTTGRTFSGTLESFMPLAGIVKARNARKSGNQLLDGDEPIHETTGESEAPRIEHGRFAQAAQVNLSNCWKLPLRPTTPRLTTD